MDAYNVGDEVEMIENGKVVDRGIVRDVKVVRETGGKVATIDWHKAGRHS